ncbi:MAG: hypothetical protein RI897_1855 [Verrucomicrobiota bacterium]
MVEGVIGRRGKKAVCSWGGRGVGVLRPFWQGWSSPVCPRGRGLGLGAGQVGVSDVFGGVEKNGFLGNVGCVVGDSLQ